MKKTNQMKLIGAKFHYKEGELFRRYSELFPAFKPITKLCINEREVIRPILDILKERFFSGF